MFQKIFGNKPCKCQQIRLDQIPASVNVLKLCITTQYISSLNGIILKKYIETKLRPNVKFKRFQFLIYQKNFRTDVKMKANFCPSKSNQNQGLKLAPVFQHSCLKNTLKQRRFFCPLKLENIPKWHRFFAHRYLC